MASSLTPHPFADLGELRERFDQTLEELTHAGTHPWRLAVDVIEHDDHYELRADVPGINAEDVKIAVEDGILKVSAEHGEESEEKQATYVRRERRYGSFSRTMAIPRGVTAGDVEASVGEGVLVVTIPRPKGAGAGAGDEADKVVEVKSKE
jgi:HSP20 family protein